MEVDLSAAEPAMDAVFQVQMVDGSPLDKILELHLLSEKPSEPDTTSRVDPRGEARFDTLTPGKRIVDPTAPNTHLAVVAIKSGRKVTTGSRIDLTRKQTGVTLVVARGKSRIEGFAQMEGRGYAGAMIVLAPQDPAVNPTEFRRDQSDSDGSFMLPDVIPGEYTVVAIEDGWELDWRRPETIARYLAEGERVTVRAGDGAQIRLSAPVKVQKR